MVFLGNSSCLVLNVSIIFSFVDDFLIPELPSGQHLVVNILTTWGDQYYVGLNGIEVFNSNGKPVQISKVSIHSVNFRIKRGKKQTNGCGNPKEPLVRPTVFG